MIPPDDPSVMSMAQAAARFGQGHVRWMIRSRRWQQPARGVVVCHRGSLTDLERMQGELLAQGRDAVLAGLTAANLDGLRNFPSTVTHILIPHGERVSKRSDVQVRRTRILGAVDIHPLKQPRRTRLPRSVVDAAAWAQSDLQARAILAAAVQQGLVTVGSLSDVVDRLVRIPRRPLIRESIQDISGGSLSEYEILFLKLVRRQTLPIPSRQVRRQDAAGRWRYLDAEFDGFRLVVEIDGQQHMEPSAWWADMARDNELIARDGKSVLRFPGFVLRHQPDEVANQIRTFMDGFQTR